MNQRVDLDRVQRRLDELWDIGRSSGGGVTRLAYSPEETQAIEYICSELPPATVVETDQVGNVYATLNSGVDGSVFMGSHLDTVNNGGRLDGALGVVVGVSVLELFQESDLDQLPSITMTIFRGEESTRFGSGTIGSRAALGMLSDEDLALTDSTGTTLAEAMNSAGFQAPADLGNPTVSLDHVLAFVETHIEQGPVLESSGVDVGIVTGIRAPVRYEVTVKGSYGHSGAVPMNLRSDALACAAEMVTTIESLAKTADSTDENIVATVGDFSPKDAAINKICGEVSFLIDIRGDTLSVRDEFESEVLSSLSTVATDRGVELDITSFYRQPPVELDDDIVRRLVRSANTVSASFKRLPSGGGHDARNFQLKGIPTGMVFVPSLDGISHAPCEQTTPQSIQTAIRILLDFMTH